VTAGHLPEVTGGWMEVGAARPAIDAQ